MRKHFLFFFLLFLACANAAEVNVTTLDYVSKISAASDGDVLLMASGTYATTFTIPSGRTITLKKAPGAQVVLSFEIGGATTDTGGGLIFDGVTINRGGDNFIYGNMGNIAKLAFYNDTIKNVNRCLLRTATAGYSLDSLIIKNCIITDCGNNTYSFIYPKHVVKNIVVKNSTLKNYISGESFFYANAASASNVFSFTFENNTVYKWGKDATRALCNTGANYSTASNYTFRNNIIAEPGVSGQLPLIIKATGGNLVAQNNLEVNVGSYSMTSATSSSITDLTLVGLGLSGVGFADVTNGDFSILSSSPLATASTSGSIVGDPRWLKVVSTPRILAISVYPVGAGTVVPANGTYNSGENVTVTATRSFGYQFKEWHDANTDALISTSNPYTFSITDNVSLKAVFDPIATYSFSVSKVGGQWGNVTLSPAATNGKYEKGTTVTMTAVPNIVTNFLNWEDNTTSLVRTVLVDADKSFTATFDEIPFIVGWDFKAQSPTTGRTGDYYSDIANAGSISMYDNNGASASWLSSTGMYTPSYPGLRMWNSASNFATPRYVQATFSTVGYANIQVKSMVAASYHVYPVMTLQYSLDGTTFTKLNQVDITTAYNSGWENLNTTLPVDAEGQAKVYIRWIEDINSTPVLGSATDVDGSAITNVYVFADKKAINDVTPPILVSSVPAENSTNASANGSIILTFDEQVKAGSGNCTLGSTVLTPAFGSKTVSFPYARLAYNTSFIFTVPAGTLTDMFGNPCAAITLHIKTMNRPQPIAKVFDFLVANDGTGNGTTIQSAFDAVPVSNGTPYLIFVKDGTYNEYPTLVSGKNFVRIIGQSRDGVVITGNRYSDGTYSTSTCQTLALMANDTYVENMTIKNTAGLSIGQAVALKCYGDRCAFKNVKLTGYQDTHLTGNGRQLYKTCEIHGSVDFIFGGGDVLFDNTTLYCEARSGGDVCTAPSTASTSVWGYVFSNCTIDGDATTQNNAYQLGRPWQNSPRSVYINTTMKILPTAAGWTDMAVVPGLFAEYNSTTALGQTVDLSNRKSAFTTDASHGNVTTSGLQTVLTNAQAATYTMSNILSGTDSWDPTVLIESTDVPANISISGSTVSWNATAYAICYIVLKDNVAVNFTTTTSYIDPSYSSIAQYKVVAVAESGALSATSSAISGLGTGLKSIESKVVAYLNDKNLVVKGIETGSIVSVYSFNGMLLNKQIATSNIILFPQSSACIVKIASNNETIALKVIK